MRAANNNSYNKRVDQLIELYDEYVNRLFANKFVDVYNKLDKNNNKANITANINYSFNDNAFIEIKNCVDLCEWNYA